jgi:hypothetical protein
MISALGEMPSTAFRHTSLSLSPPSLTSRQRRASHPCPRWTTHPRPAQRTAQRCTLRHRRRSRMMRTRGRSTCPLSPHPRPRLHPDLRWSPSVSPWILQHQTSPVRRPCGNSPPSGPPLDDVISPSSSAHAPPPSYSTSRPPSPPCSLEISSANCPLNLRSTSSASSTIIIPFSPPGGSAGHGASSARKRSFGGD